MGNKPSTLPIFVSVQSADDDGFYPKYDSLLGDWLIPTTQTFSLNRSRSVSIYIT